MPIYTKPKYCVYLTSYSGNKLPQFYIGSTLISKVNSGYKGSVKSKKYKDIYKQEFIDNPHLFKTKIIATYYSRKKAQYKERIFQTKLNVVKSDMYINMTIAKDFGWFGMCNKKEDSPVFGKRWKKTPEQIENARKANIEAFSKKEYKEKISKLRKGKLPMSESKKLELLAMYKEVFALYNSKPDLEYGYVRKNGKVMTYERAFAEKYHHLFNRSVNGIVQILTKDRIGKKLI